MDPFPPPALVRRPAGGPVLTHGGRSLGELEDLSGRPDALADLDDAELADLERQLHFGGGGEGEEDGGGREGRPKSRKEVGRGAAGAGRAPMGGGGP
jgi:hypothetical protein